MAREKRKCESDVVLCEGFKKRAGQLSPVKQKRIRKKILRKTSGEYVSCLMRRGNLRITDILNNLFFFRAGKILVLFMFKVSNGVIRMFVTDLMEIITEKLYRMVRHVRCESGEILFAKFFIVWQCEPDLCVDMVGRR